VHVKTQLAQEQRMLLSSHRLLQRKLLHVECDLHGTLIEARIRELGAS
jgi:transposase